MESSIASAELIGTLLEVAVYCIYATLIPRAYLALRRKGSHGLLTRYLYFTLFASLLFNTLHASISVGRVIYAFTTHTDQAGFAETYLSRQSSPLFLVKMVCTSVVIVLSDALIVLRTYIIWERSPRVILLPTLLLVADIGHSVEVMVIIYTNNEFLVTPSLMFFAAISWGLNLLCSGLIGYRIWKSRRILQTYFAATGGRLNNALTIIIESALVYSLISLASLITTVLGAAALFSVTDVTPPLVGIVFLHVIISSSNFKANGATHQSSAVSDALSGHGPSDHQLESEVFNTQAHPPSSGVVVQVTLEKTIHTEDPECASVYDGTK
ncbi:hypothetical protein QCA50_014611 [Cerrena zonata]|uniref:Uncharacterized protein n=1 Tax=Cerrena zonata TaxID=2478898 RepID=A0AAW0FNI9_9APHY